VGLAGKLKTGLKNEFGPVEHEQGATRSNQKEEEGEKEEYEEGGRGGPAAGGPAAGGPTAGAGKENRSMHWQYQREERKVWSSGAHQTINRNFD
jgi:hypothetical protein